MILRKTKFKVFVVVVVIEISMKLLVQAYYRFTINISTTLYIRNWVPFFYVLVFSNLEVICSWNRILNFFLQLVWTTQWFYKENTTSVNVLAYTKTRFITPLQFIKQIDNFNWKTNFSWLYYLSSFCLDFQVKTLATTTTQLKQNIKDNFQHLGSFFKHK